MSKVYQMYLEKILSFAKEIKLFQKNLNSLESISNVSRKEVSKVRMDVWTNCRRASTEDREEIITRNWKY